MKMVLWLFLLLGLALAQLPMTAADEEWSDAKTRIVDLKRDEFTSPALSPQIVSGDYLRLPAKDPSGIAVKVTGQKILVDKDQKGKPDFTACQGQASKPFTLTLLYEDGEKANHIFKIVTAGGGFALVRQSGIEVSLGKEKVFLLDENSNGIYGEEGEDGIYVSGRCFGSPFSHLVSLGGTVYEMKVSQSGLKIQYRAYTGKTGSVDISKNWGGKTIPTCAVAVGKTADNSRVYFDVAEKGSVVLPVGEYKIHCAWLPKVRVDASRANITFTVAEGETASPEWGKGLKMNAQVGYDDKKASITLAPLPTVTGAAGENYIGEYMDDGKFRIAVDPCNANGAPVGKGTNWTKTVIGGGG